MEGQNERKRASIGFSLIELAVVVGMGLVLTAVTVPRVLGTYNPLQLKAAATAVKSVVQTTRFQAILNGYPYQLVLTTANSNDQITRRAYRRFDVYQCGKRGNIL